MPGFLNDSSPENNQPRAISEKEWRTAVKTPAGKALLAHKLSNGGAFVSGLNQRQAARATGASQGDVSRVGRTTDEEREAIALGEIPLAKLREKSPSDAAIDKYIGRAGLRRIIRRADPSATLAVLDEMTAPIPPAESIALE